MRCVGALQNHEKSLRIKKLRNMIIDWKLLSIYACKFQKKNCEANTLAMLFEAHRSLLIDFFGAQPNKNCQK